MTATMEIEELPKPFWLERLESTIKKVNGGEITAAQSRNIMLYVAEGTMATWSKLGVIERRQQRELKKIKKEDSDWMRSGLKWFADKVLPSLLASGIIGAVIWFAAVAGHIG
jgi:hypothetical protein